VVGQQRLPVDLDAAGPGQPAGAFDDGGAVALVAGDLLGIIEVADHEVAVVADRRPRQVGPVQAEGAVGLAARLGWAQQRLGGDAGPVGALAADQLAFHDRNLAAGGEQAAGGDLAAWAHAKHDHVELLSHRAQILSRLGMGAVAARCDDDLHPPGCRSPPAGGRRPGWRRPAGCAQDTVGQHDGKHQQRHSMVPAAGRAWAGRAHGAATGPGTGG